MTAHPKGLGWTEGWEPWGISHTRLESVYRESRSCQVPEVARCVRFRVTSGVGLGEGEESGRG